MDSQFIFSRVFKRPAYFIAFGFGSGLSPFAPGTAGSIVGILLFILFHHLTPIAYFFIVALLFGLGVYVSQIVTDELGVQDYGGIVIDEVVGMLLTYFLLPFSFIALVLGFLLFRLFDIVKPFPIGLLDAKVLGGFGIMIDDVLAALYAWLCLHFLLWVL